MTNFDFSRVVYDEENVPRTADVVVVVIVDGLLEVLLITRGSEPFLGQYAIPGGFMEKSLDNGPADAAARELKEETGLSVAQPLEGYEEKISPAFEMNRLHWLGKYNAPGRDPRFQTRTDTYWALMDAKPEVAGGDDATDAQFVAYSSLMERVDKGETVLAFDHDSYLIDLRRAMVRYGVFG